MNKKIIRILICMLLLATAVPAVESLKNNAINATIPRTPLASMAGSWAEGQKFLASDGAAYDDFGFSVSISGDTALIAALGDDDNGDEFGSVYVFTRTGTTWTQQQKLLAADGTSYNNFGFCVSLSGDTALIGACGENNSGVNSGAAYVFTRTDTSWTQQQKLTASDGAAEDLFGDSVSLDGDTALIAAEGDDDNGQNSGSAYVFTRSGTTWTQQQKLLASDGAEGDYFGWSVSLDGDTALIGAGKSLDSSNFIGAAYVFTWTGTTWTQQAKLLAADGAEGDYFGCSVSLDEDTALIGADSDADNGIMSGSAYVFTCTGTTWTQQAKLLASDGAELDSFGYSVSLDGDIALIGAPAYFDNLIGLGSAYVFTRTGTAWIQQQKLLASDGEGWDNFGYTVSLSGNTALIGAYRDDDNGDQSGSVYVFMKGGIGIDIIGGLGVNVVIKNNNETVPITRINWEIIIKGGILGMMNKTMKGTIDVIDPGKSETVGTGMLFGLGPIAITVKVADNERTAKGTQFIIFSMVK